jgi:oligoendopeptidase F
MAKMKSLPKRDQVKTSDTWDLTPLCKSDAEWEKGYRKLEKMITRFEEFRGQLGKSAKVLRQACDFESEFEQLGEKLGVYAYLKSSEDVASSTYQGMLARFTYLSTRAGEAASFMAPEIQAVPQARMAAFIKSAELKPYKFQLERLLRYRPHILSQKEERLLAMQGEVAGSASRVFSQLNDADLKFGTVTDDRGKKVELTQGSFRGLLESSKRAVRKEAFPQVLLDV